MLKVIWSPNDPTHCLNSSSLNLKHFHKVPRPLAATVVTGMAWDFRENQHSNWKRQAANEVYLYLGLFFPRSTGFTAASKATILVHLLREGANSGFSLSIYTMGYPKNVHLVEAEMSVLWYILSSWTGFLPVMSETGFFYRDHD